jgi:hypothetical protein
LKNIIIIVACSSLNPCSSSDEIENIFDGELFNTVWLGTRGDEGESYTLRLDQDFKYVREETITSGIYTFDGANGVLTASYDTHLFKIEGTKMTVENGNSRIYVYIKN